tara:strand:+ start:258 stop:1007 length:750 start_codon:yes stop_codon:yes gene_type:complete
MRYVAKKVKDANGNVDYIIMDTTTNKPVSRQRLNQAFFQAPAQSFKTIRKNGKPLLINKASGNPTSRKEINQLIAENRQLAEMQQRIHKTKFGIAPTIRKLTKPISKALGDFGKIGVWSDDSASLPYSERHKRRTMLQVQRENLNKKPETEKEVEDQAVADEEAEVAVTKAKADIQTPTPVTTSKLTPKPVAPDTGGSSEPIAPKTFKDIWGKNPTIIQKKLMEGGWTAQELYQKKLAHNQWKKNRRRK